MKGDDCFLSIMNKYFKLILVAIVFILSFASIYITSVDYEYATYVRVDEETGEEEIVDTRDYDEDELRTQMAFDYFNLKKQNSDTVAWLNVPNIGYYPIVAAEDNQFYLNHDEYKRNSSLGCPFLNTKSEKSFKDVALIHGHHIKNGRIFGSLKKYKDTEFFQTNDLICVFDGEYYYYYKPFTVFLYEDGEANLFKFGLVDTFRTKYVDRLLERSLAKMEVGAEINPHNQIIFLTTCDYQFTNARLCVGGIMVEQIKYEE